VVKLHLAGIALSLAFSAPGWAATADPVLIVTPPQPSWRELTIQQKIILAPLSDDWDSLEDHRQKTWLSIAERFHTMTSLKQRRIQGQMQKWGRLSPEQRQLARENFKTIRKLPADKKLELKKKWEEYSGLSEQEKVRIKRDIGRRRPLHHLEPPFP